MSAKPETPAGRAVNRILIAMLDELEGSFHEVVLVPAPDPQHSEHKIRLCHMQNCEWYRKFAALYTNCRGMPPKHMRRPRTFVRKDRTAATLRRMIDGNFSGVQAERLVDFITRLRVKHRNRKQKVRLEFSQAEFSDIPF